MLLRLVGGDFLNQKEHEPEKQDKNRRRLILLLIFYSLTLAFTAFLLGKSSGFTGYSGQLIDTIILSSALKPDGSGKQAEFVSLYGTVTYSNGQPYKNGVIELQSDPRYTTTDNNGSFLFQNVAIGKHTISIIENGKALVSRDITIQTNTNTNDVLYLQQENGSYVVNIPVKINNIEIQLELHGKTLSVKKVSGNEREIPASSTVSDNPNKGGTSQPGSTPPTSETPKQSGSPHTSGTPEPSTTPSPSVTPTPSTTPSPSVTPTPLPAASPSDTESTPGVVVSDAYSSKKWTQISMVDIFAPRSGNTGVSRKDGKNVIEPGANGSYVIKLKNPEDYVLSYTIWLTESDGNKPKIPMKYYISKGTTGLDKINDYMFMSASDISESGTLAAGDSQDYTIQWKWVSLSDSQDTDIGMQIDNPSYILKINVQVQQK